LPLPSTSQLLPLSPLSTITTHLYRSPLPIASFKEADKKEEEEIARMMVLATLPCSPSRSPSLPYLLSSPIHPPFLARSPPSLHIFPSTPRLFNLQLSLTSSILVCAYASLLLLLDCPSCLPAFPPSSLLPTFLLFFLPSSTPFYLPSFLPLL
jgi:hypothetical protein